MAERGGRQFLLKARPGSTLLMEVLVGRKQRDGIAEGQASSGLLVHATKRVESRDSGAAREMVLCQQGFIHFNHCVEPSPR